MLINSGRDSLRGALSSAIDASHGRPLCRVNEQPIPSRAAMKTDRKSESIFSSVSLRHGLPQVDKAQRVRFIVRSTERRSTHRAAMKRRTSLIGCFDA